MKKLFTLLLGSMLVMPVAVFAQEENAPKPTENTEKEAPVTEEKPAKDGQNQTQFMKPDMESSKYSYQQRKGVSTPLMMSYDQDDAAYQKGGKREKQQQSYKKAEYYFPAKPKNMWELGVNFGPAVITGDVRPYYSDIKGALGNWGVGGTLRKAFGYVGSIRLGYNHFRLTGRNWEPDQNLTFNKALRGAYDSRVNYFNNPNLTALNTTEGFNMNKLFFYNYQTYIHEVSLVGIVNVGNIRYHRERNLVNFYILAGASGSFFTTYMDALDDNGNVYDLSPVYSLYKNPLTNQDVNAKFDRRKEALKRLDQIFDGKYESAADRTNNSFGIKNWAFLPAATVGAGVQFHLSKWVTLGIEQRFIISGNDLLDGYRWQQDAYPGFTRDNDNVSYSSINLNFHLGNPKKNTEPLYWLNPNHHTYKKLGEMDPSKLADDLLKDDDDDGVPNKLDKEPGTKKDCPVDTKGRALDSDKDGIIDCDDKEPYSAPGYPVDSFGVAILPPNPCCDTSGYDYYDDGTGGTGGPGGGVRYDENGNPIPGSGTGPGTGPNRGKGRRGSGGFDCAKTELPAVAFDIDKYYLDPQYFGNLHQIAERMQMCPDMKLVVTGFDESKNDQKYNEQLAWNRANATVDYLVEKYGISRDRFIVKYQGGKKAATGTPYQMKMKNKVEFRYAGDNESGDSNPPAPHPGLKAGSNK